MRNAVRLILISAVALGLLTGAFFAGLGSGYVLTHHGAQIAGQDSAPTLTPAAPTAAVTPVPTAAESESPTPEPTATQMPTPTSVATPIGTDEGSGEDFQLLWEVWDLVQDHFYGDVPDMQEVTYAAIRGMLSTLDDDHTVFIEPEFAAALSEEATGEFQGIGAFVGLDEDGRLEMVKLFQGGPAEAAGLIAGDRVLEVDGVSLSGRTLHESISLIRGPADTQVTLLVQRQGIPEPFDVTVTRARLEIPITEVEMRDDGIGYIRLHGFSATASRLMEEGLKELLESEPHGIILDLRQNPGGWLDQAVEVADLFLGDGIVLVERRSDGTEQVFESDPGDLAESVPLVVLVDRGSASASEIVAGAIQDRERAILVGESTLGKGSVQRPFALGDGSELRVTTALWFTPNNQAIHGTGLIPDIEVLAPEQEDASADVGIDVQLERAVEYLLTGE